MGDTFTLKNQFMYVIYKMKSQQNNTNNKKYSLFGELMHFEKKEQGIHPDMIIGPFKAKNIREGMTVSGVYISDIVENPCSEFVVIKKDAFYKNIPSRDTILSPGQKIRINDKDKRVETLIDNINICKLFLPEIKTLHFLSNKKDYIYINNIQTLCGNNKKYIDDYKNVEDLIL
jgi:hypothetical protein